MPSSNELIADRYRTYALRIIQASTSFYQKDIVKLLNKLEKKLVKRLASSSISGNGTLTQMESARIQQLLDFVRITTRDAYQDISARNADFLLSLSAFEAKFTQYNAARGLAEGLLTRDELAAFGTIDYSSIVEEGIGVKKILATQVIPSTVEVELKNFGVRILQLPTEDQIRGIVKFSPIQGTPTEEYWMQQSETVRRKFESVMRQGLLDGSSNSELIDRIRGTEANNFKDGIFEAPIRDASALVRTSSLAVMNRTRLEMLNMPKNQTIVKGVQQVSTLDSRTSAVCIAYSGKAWSLPDYEPIGHSLPFNGGPPRHWHCRSTIIPVTKSFKELGIDLDEIPKGTRATVDGQVPADLSFNDWLKTKTRAFQDDLLGVGKANLWRNGKISLTDLVNQSGQERSLAELKRAFD